MRCFFLRNCSSFPLEPLTKREFTAENAENAEKRKEKGETREEEKPGADDSRLFLSFLCDLRVLCGELFLC